MGSARLTKDEKRLCKMPTVSRIEVSRDIIEGAVQCNTHECIVHNAIVAAYPDAMVWVDGQKIRVKLNGVIHYAPTPGIAWGAIASFDCDKPVAPFSFNLKLTGAKRSKPNSEHRKRQINAARNARAAAGNPDKVYSRVAGRRVTPQEWAHIKAKVRRDIEIASAS